MTLQELLKEKGFTTYRLAKNADIGQATASEIVNGKRKCIRAVTAEKIAKTLGTTVEVINSCMRSGSDAS